MEPTAALRRPRARGFGPPAAVIDKGLKHSKRLNHKGHKGLLGPTRIYIAMAVIHQVKKLRKNYLVVMVADAIS
jgi:hypothetical protein